MKLTQELKELKELNCSIKESFKKLISSDLNPKDRERVIKGYNEFLDRNLGIYYHEEWNN